MAGTLILWLVYAVFLKLAIGLATAVIIAGSDGVRLIGASD